jgi:iron uptake system component EfeO
VHLTAPWSRPALLVSVVLAGALAGCGSDKKPADGAAVRTIEVKLTDDGCDPAAISTTAGPVTFHVTNDGAAGVTEFEVLSGSKILAEVENVAPGIDRSFSLTLDNGSFVTYCPGAKTEKGTLVVSGAGAGTSSSADAAGAGAVKN